MLNLFQSVAKQLARSTNISLVSLLTSEAQNKKDKLYRTGNVTTC